MPVTKAYNPFREPVEADPSDENLVERAKAGDRAALEELVRRHQGWIFNIVVRMVYRREDAEDLTQEILVKAITHLGTFRAESRFRTWLYRIAANQALDFRKEAASSDGSFIDYGRSIDETPDRDLPDPASVPVELPILVEEVRIGCTVGMLLCLDRRQRLAFTLGEILGVSDKIGGEIMEVTPANFRQMLSRARRDLYAFMTEKCGLVNQANPCRCAKKTRGFMEQGFVDPNRMQFTPDRMAQVRSVASDRLEELRALDRQHAEIFREHPFLTVPDQVEKLRGILADPRFRWAVEGEA
jgi:RNA polymerase sigma factor (sigma-70 family)